MQEWVEYQQLVLKLLEQHDTQIGEMKKEFNALSVDSALLESQLNNLKETTTQILQIVRDGYNSEDSVLRRLDKIEKNVSIIVEENSKLVTKDKEVSAFKRTLLVTLGVTILNIAWQVIQKLIGG